MCFKKEGGGKKLYNQNRVHLQPTHIKENANGCTSGRRKMVTDKSEMQEKMEKPRKVEQYF